MNQLILCTTGTSIANGCTALRQAQGQVTSWDEPLPELQKQIAEKLERSDYDIQTEQGRRRLSAELNTLDRLSLKTGDRVVLLATDSAPGRICSEANKKVIETVYGVDVTVERIPGLQVYDAKRLREEGLKNLVRIVLDRYLDNDQIRYSYDTLINPTGGYKGIVPFLTVLGMLYGKKAIYLFEFSEELIELPPLPLTFDYDIFQRVEGALKFLEKEGAAPEEAYLKKIVAYDPAERDLFLSFVEIEEGLVTLSPLAYVLLKIEENAHTPLVSETAIEQIEAQKGQKRTVLERLVLNCANPLWRTHHIHRWKDSDLLIIKPGNTSERLAGFMKDGVFHVALAFANHNEYEKELPKYTLSDFKERTFAPFKPHIVKEIEWSDTEELGTYVDRLTYEKKELEEDLLKLEERLEETKATAIKAQEACTARIHELENELLRVRKESSQPEGFLDRLKWLIFGHHE